MNNTVQFEIQFEDDEAILDQLTRFFEPFATVHVKKRDPIEAKSLQTVVNLTVSIIAEWAAVRYVLDPLADRASEWFNGVKSIWKSGFKRPFNIVVKLGPTDDTFQVRMSPTTDQRALSKIWNYVREAYCICEQSRTQSVLLDKIRIVPDGTREMLVLGYEGNHPKYIVDLDNKALRLIHTTSSVETEGEVSGQLWLIEHLIKSLSYRKMLREHGFDVQQDEIQKLEQLIIAEKTRLGVHK
jgi:hypothetical protein